MNGLDQSVSRAPTPRPPEQDHAPVANGEPLGPTTRQDPVTNPEEPVKKTEEPMEKNEEPIESVKQESILSSRDDFILMLKHTLPDALDSLFSGFQPKGSSKSVKQSVDHPAANDSVLEGTSDELYRVRLVRSDEKRPDQVRIAEEHFEYTNADNNMKKLHRKIEYMEDIHVVPRRSPATGVEYQQRVLQGETWSNIDEDFYVHSVRDPLIKIQDKGFRYILNQVCDYYPGQSLFGVIYIHYPFRILWHYYDDILREARLTRDEIEVDKCPPELDETQSVVYKVFKMMRLKRDTWDELRNERQCYEEKKEAGWEHLWLLYTPGTDVYAKVDGHWARFVVVKTMKIKKAWHIITWLLAYDPPCLRRVKHRFVIQEYNGEKRICSLEVFPCEYLDSLSSRDEDGIDTDAKTKRKLTELGKTYWDILRARSRYMSHSGFALGDKENGTSAKRHDGLVIADPKGYYDVKHQAKPDKEGMTVFAPFSFFMDENGTDVKVSNDLSPPDEDYPDKWAELRDLDPADEQRAFDSAKLEEHFCRFSRRIPGFALGEKEWLLFDISNLREVTNVPGADDIKDRLKLPGKDIECLTSVLERFKHDAATPHTFQLDDIPKKGAGKSFLLHGPPGTGKTYTAECIAQWAKRPLLHLNAADIGSNAKEMEAALSEWFNLAERWRAIVLLDEADSFFNQRRADGNSRDALVCAFLRQMEYFPGVLFLTTNLPGFIDEAIVARIQIPIGYTHNEACLKAIWNKFFQVINNDWGRHGNGDITQAVMVSRKAQIWALQNVEDEFEKLKAWEKQSDKGETGSKRPEIFWNGREIRNVLEIAKSVALQRSGSSTVAEIEDEDLESAKQRKVEFNDYISNVFTRKQHREI